MGDNNKEILLTEEGYKKMEAELEKLKTETRAEIAERIKSNFETFQKIQNMMKLKMRKQKMKIK